MPLPANKTASELGFKVGDRFRITRVSKSSLIPLNATVELVEDDESEIPKFNMCDDGYENTRIWVPLSNLEPLNTPKPKKTTITRIDTTIYSDDVRIEWGNKDLIFIDGLGKTREEWTKYWSRIGNVLRRKR